MGLQRRLLLFADQRRLGQLTALLDGSVQQRPNPTITGSRNRALQLEGAARRMPFPSSNSRPACPAYRARASKVAGMSERTWMPQWSPARVTIHSAGTVQ